MVDSAAVAGQPPRAPVLFMIYLFFARWWRRLRPPAPARLPIYQAGPTSSPARGGAPPAPPSMLSLSPGKLKILLRVDKFCLDYGVCTAGNDRLAENWHGPGRPCTPRHIRRLLLELAREGFIEGWFEARLCTPENPVGRALRACTGSSAPQRQLEIRGLGQPRRARPDELARGFPAATPPPPTRRRGDPSTPERRSGGHDPRTPMSAGHVRPGGVDMSTDPRSEIRSPKEAVYETVTGPGQAAPVSGAASSSASGTASAGQADRGAASPPATDATAERLRRHALEMSRRRKLGSLRLFTELHEGAKTCERCKALDGQKEHRLVQGQRVPIGLLFPTVEAADEAARGHTELHPAPPEDDGTDEAENVYEAEAAPGAHGKVRIVDKDGAPAYFHADSSTWVPLDEEGVDRAVRLGWAVDERPPRGAPPRGAGQARPPDPDPLADLDIFLDEADVDEIGAGAGP